MTSSQSSSVQLCRYVIQFCRMVILINTVDISSLIAAFHGCQKILFLADLSAHYRNAFPFSFQDIQSNPRQREFFFSPQQQTLRITIAFSHFKTVGMRTLSRIIVAGINYCICKQVYAEKNYSNYYSV